MATLRRITVEGYKSIKQMSLDLRQLNVLIGANGAGKSNLISLFALLGEMVTRRLQIHVGRSGGANALLHYGVKCTPRLRAVLDFQSDQEFFKYDFTLGADAQESLFIEEQHLEYPQPYPSGLRQHTSFCFGRGLPESVCPEDPPEPYQRWVLICDLFERCQLFHFDDTSETSPIRRSGYIHDNRSLTHDGGNLAPFLYRMKQTERVAYDRTIRTIQQAMPWFADFVIEPLELNKNNVQLDWHERGSDLLFGPHQLPDGALRAMALFTLLLQPKEWLPRIIVIDEPELGLHPSAINILAGLAEAAARHCQIVLATQSVTLVDHLDPDEVIAVDREDGASTFKRVPDQMSAELLKEWLDDYSLSELWEKNVIGGGPF